MIKLLKSLIKSVYDQFMNPHWRVIGYGDELSVDWTMNNRICKSTLRIVLLENREGCRELRIHWIARPNGLDPAERDFINKRYSHLSQHQLLTQSVAKLRASGNHSVVEYAQSRYSLDEFERSFIFSEKSKLTVA